MFEELRKRMRAKGLKSVQDLVREADMTDGTLYARMRGEKPFTAWEMVRIARILNIPLEEIGEVFCGQDMRRGKSAELERAAKQAVERQRRKAQKALKERGLA